MKTLLTAFGPFPGIPVNPSELLLRTFASEFATELLETRYSSAGDKVAAAIGRLRPTLLIMLGVRSRNSNIALERFALNMDDCLTPDAAGITRLNQPIIPGAPAAYETSIDLPALHRSLTPSPVPIEISNHAGTYLCNHAYYRALHHAATLSPATRVLFVHIPMPPAPDALDPIVRTIRELIRQTQRLCDLT